MQYTQITQMKMFGKQIISVLTFAFLLVSCTDDFYTENRVPEGETEFAATVSFPAFAPALETRAGGAAGDAIKEINSLWLVIYEEGEDGGWTLEKGGKIRLTEDEHHLVTSTPGTTPPGSDAQASFRLRHKNGQYKIYAVANYDLAAVADTDIATPEKLKGLSLTWDKGNVWNNAEMFGCFANDEAITAAADETVTVGPNRTLHAWIRRAASKLTVAFDTQRLNENITIYIKSVTIKDIPAGCYLGKDNTPTTSGELEDGDILYFGNAAGSVDDYMQWRKLSKETQLWGYRSEKEGTPAGQSLADRRKWEHGETVDALYFYENMQGEGKNKAQTAPGPGNNNGGNAGIGYPNPVEGDGQSGWKDNKPCGTYVEVEGYYVSNIVGNVNRGNITYRFMLGKNTSTDYNAERNHHYKLTLVFNGNANDADWHIEYKAQVLQVGTPQPFNYQGKTFQPDASIPNLGHNFISNNVITVSSYEGDKANTDNYKAFTVSFREEGQTEFSDKCDWLGYSIDEGIGAGCSKQVKFTATSKYEEIDITEKLQKATTKGSASAPYNLADQGGKTNSEGIESTANCYIVDAPGVYMLPLVYGNAIADGSTNKSSYDVSPQSDTKMLAVFKNHLGGNITGPYISDMSGSAPSSATLVWQDEKDLVTNVKYVSGAYGGKGGISFNVASGTIKQGNAVIAIKDNKGLIMWSWHIWVTRFDFEKTVTVTTNQYNDDTPAYDLLSVNLGWCAGGQKVRYYKGRKCEVKFTSGELEEIRTIEQYPHTAFPCGDNPYYQWGRKDPFWGTRTAWGNKERYDAAGKYYGVGAENNPKRFYGDTSNTPEGEEVDESKRRNTRQLLEEGLLIQNPDTWHNPPRKQSGGGMLNNNETYDNLWGGGSITLKTVYDPCPVGFFVPHYNAFSGFVVIDKSGAYWVLNYDVAKAKTWGYNTLPENMADPTAALYEIYITPDKYRSIIFPVSGYRDWDAAAGVISLYNLGYAWSRIINPWAATDVAYLLEVTNDGSNSGKGINPIGAFNTCDGLPIRPARVSESSGF